MNLEDIVEAYDRKHGQKIGVDEVHKTLFVCPAGDELPSDGVLNYVTIETVFDLANVPDRSVVVIRPDQLGILKCVAENTTVFKLDVRVLTGLPGAAYGTEFEAATWAFEKVAYAPFISELRVASEIESQLAAQSQSQHDAEKERYSRKDGSVKEHRDFTVASVGVKAVPVGDDDVADEEMIGSI